MNIIDVRSAGGQLGILGGSLTLPNSDTVVSGTVAVGGLRYNTGTENVKVWTGAAWVTVGSFASVTLTGAVTGTGIGTIATTMNSPLNALTDVTITSPTSNQVLSYNSGATQWENVSAPYDIYGTFLGKPSADQPLWRIVFARSVTFPTNLTGSTAACYQEATASISLPILQNGIQVGSIDFAPSVLVGTFTFSSPVTFVSGDILEIDGPSATDATFFSPSWSFAAQRN